MLGIFDSGVGGLTVLRHIHQKLPQYSTVYLGDSAHWPYGTKTHEEIANFTWEAVQWLFSRGCPLVILACNSASSQALRTIQQTKLDPNPKNRVLGVIRPTVEALAEKYNHIGVLATPVTVASGAYVKEFQKINPQVRVSQHACPTWVSFVEEGKTKTPQAQLAVKEDVEALLSTAPDIEAVLLGCTHYPALFDQIRSVLPQYIELFDQGPIVAESLENYLKRHPEIESRIDKKETRKYLVTGNPQAASYAARQIIGQGIDFEQVDLSSKSG